MELIGQMRFSAGSLITALIHFVHGRLCSGVLKIWMTCQTGICCSSDQAGASLRIRHKPWNPYTSRSELHPRTNTCVGATSQRSGLRAGSGPHGQ